MPLISLNPKSTEMLIADYAKLGNKFLLVIDNSKYHTLAADKKATVLAYYDSIIPEAEIDRIFELTHTYYAFATELQATDYCFDWFPQNYQFNFSVLLEFWGLTEWPLYYPMNYPISVQFS